MPATDCSLGELNLGHEALLCAATGQNAPVNLDIQAKEEKVLDPGTGRRGRTDRHPPASGMMERGQGVHQDVEVGICPLFVLHCTSWIILMSHLLNEFVKGGTDFYPQISWKM